MILSRFKGSTYKGLNFGLSSGIEYIELPGEKKELPELE